jgi:hypothetical protein
MLMLGVAIGMVILLVVVADLIMARRARSGQPEALTPRPPTRAHKSPMTVPELRLARRSS